MKKLLLSTLLVSAIFANTLSNAEIKQEAKDAIMKLQKTLQTQLKANLKKGGPVQAANFCSARAQAIAHEVNVSFAKEITVHRTSLKYHYIGYIFNV